MRKLTIVALSLAGAAVPAPAFAQGSYYIRNDTQRPLTCGLRRPRSEVMVPLALGPGREWREETARSDTRVLICYNGAQRQTFRLVSGQRYALSEDNAGTLRLRALGN